MSQVRMNREQKQEHIEMVGRALLYLPLVTSGTKGGNSPLIYITDNGLAG
jgi:hypothetical protein